MTLRSRVRRPRRRNVESGFTLLEIMLSLAILAIALVTLIRITTRNVQATNRVKVMTAATFLARAKIVEIEDRVIAVGFTDLDEEASGDFSNENYPQIAWESIVERIRLPTNITQQGQNASSSAMKSSQSIGQQSPLQFMAGMMGGMMTTLMEPIRIGLQESVRRVTVRVFWNEVGKPEQTFEVVTFMTDPARLDMAMPGAGAAVGAGPAGAATTAGSAAPGVGRGTPGATSASRPGGML